MGAVMGRQRTNTPQTSTWEPQSNAQWYVAAARGTSSHRLQHQQDVVFPCGFPHYIPKYPLLPPLYTVQHLLLLALEGSAVELQLLAFQDVTVAAS